VRRELISRCGPSGAARNEAGGKIAAANFLRELSSCEFSARALLPTTRFRWRAEGAMAGWRISITSHNSVPSVPGPDPVQSPGVPFLATPAIRPWAARSSCTACLTGRRHPFPLMNTRYMTRARARARTLLDKACKTRPLRVSLCARTYGDPTRFLSFVRSPAHLIWPPSFPLPLLL